MKKQHPIENLARAAGRYALLGALVLAPVALLTAAIAAEPQPSVAVTTVPARRAPLAQTVRAYGVAAMAPSDVTDVTVSFTARIARIWVSAGQPVTRGAVLADLVPDPAAVLAYQQASTAVDLAKGELARTQQLYEQQLATQSQLAQAKKALGDASQAQLAQHQIGAVSAQQRVTAPFDGVVVSLSAAQGAQLQAGTPLMQLAHTGGAGTTQPRVVVAVEPADAARLRTGAQATLSLLSAGPNRATLQGTVSMVGSAIDPQTQLVNVVVTYPPGSSSVLPGARVVADVALSQGEHWIVPRSAVLSDASGAYVFQVNDGRARRVNVMTQVDQGAALGVDGPLHGAWPVVETGNYQLQDGMPVRAAGAAR